MKEVPNHVHDPTPASVTPAAEPPARSLARIINNVGPMKLRKLAEILSYGSVAALASLFSGCGTSGMKYSLTNGSDSVKILGPGVPEQNAEEKGTSEVSIVKIDGLGANFYANTARPGWAFPKAPLELAAGQHSLTLDISQLDSVTGTPGPRNAGSYGDTIFSYTKPTIDVHLTGNHTYRLAASVVGNTIELILWDETDRANMTTIVRRWMFSGNSEYHRG
jgi:hypothetical protein